MKEVKPWAILFGLLLLCGFGVWLGWNALVPTVFHGPRIPYWATVAFLAGLRSARVAITTGV